MVVVGVLLVVQVGAGRGGGGLAYSPYFTFWEPNKLVYVAGSGKVQKAQLPYCVLFNANLDVSSHHVHRGWGTASQVLGLGPRVSRHY